jgi:thiol:disulfide interchange protein DsbA
MEMQMSKRLLAGLVTGLTLLFAAGLAQAQLTAGNEYRVLSTPQPTDTPGKIEVIEFFWYGCPHCYHFDPILEPWVKKLPKDVQFRRVPAIFNADWENTARAYYALEAIGESEHVHKALFDAVNQSTRLNPASEAAVTEWLGKKGIDTKKFTTAYRSFSVEGKLKRAKQLTQAYKIEGVPTMAVNGVYVINTDNIKSFDQMLAIADYLVDQARKNGAKPAPKK